MDPTPDLLTIEEAARVLRIGRTKAYAMGQEYRTTNTQSGMKVIEVGGQLRVPRAWLEDKLGGPVLTIPPAPCSSNGNGIEAKPKRPADTPQPTDEPTPSPAPTRATKRRPRKSARVNDNQLTLPFG
jgi:hypothetical protein